MKEFVSSWARFVVKRRWPVILVTVFLLAGLAYPMKNLYFDNSNEMWFVEGDPALTEFDLLLERFGDNEYFLIGIEATGNSKNVFEKDILEVIEKLTVFLEDHPTITKVTSLTKYQQIHSEDDLLSVDYVIPEYLEGYDGSSEQMKRVAEVMAKETLVHDMLITKDFKHTIVSARVEHKKGGIDHHVRLIRDTMAFIEQEGLEKKDLKLHFTGTPYIDENFFSNSMSDQQLTYPLMFLLIVGVLILTFRGWAGIVMPLVVILGSVVAVLGTIGLMGWAMNMLNVTLPIILMAVGVGDSIHILVDFYHNRNKGMDAKSAAIRTIEELFVPCFNTSLTTGIGFAAISVSRLQPLAEFGVVASMGVIVAFLISVTTLPALLSLTKDKSEKSEKITEMGLVARLTSNLTGYNRHYRYVIAGGGLLLTLVSLWGASKIVVDANFINYFKEDTRMRRDLNYFNDTYSGGIFLEYMIDTGTEGGAYEPDFLRQVEAFQTDLEKMDRSGKANSMVNFLKKMNQALHDDDPAWFVLPDSRQLVAQYLLLYSNSGPEEDLSDLKTPDNRYIRVSQRLVNMPTSEMTEFVDKAEAILKSKYPELQVQISGTPILFNNMNVYILEGLVQSFSLAIILIVICFFVLLRSVKYGLLALIPSLFPILFAGGIMGFTGFYLDFATMIVAAITFGIAVDDTIHFLTRFKRAHKSGKSIAESSHLAVIEAGRALIFTSIILFLGFSILMLSSFIPNIKLGFFAGVILLVALIASLTLLPSVLFIFVKNGTGSANQTSTRST